MKKITFLFVMGLLSLSFACFSQIKVNSSGYVGINKTSPAYRLDVGGNVRMGESGYEVSLSYGMLAPYTAGYFQLGSNSTPWSEIYGDYIECYDLVELSDEGLKKEVTNVSGVKKSVLALQPVKYKLTLPRPAKENTMAERGYQFGFLAQDVQKIFPDLVNTPENGKLGVRYLGFIPLLVETIKEQQSEIDDLKARLEKLEAAQKQTR